MTKKLTNGKLLLGLPSEVPDLRYASGFTAPDPVVFLQTSHTKYLVVPVLEYGRAKRSVQGVHVLSVEELKLPPEKRRSIAEWALALIKRAGVSEVQVHWSFPLLVARRLQRGGVKIVPERGALFPTRSVKTPTEIKNIRMVQQAAVIAMRVALRKIKGATVDSSGCLCDASQRIDSDHLRHLIEQTLFDRNCTGNDTIVACGPLSADPHERGHGYLRAGQPIVIDIFPRHREHGYWGDITRTVVKGSPPEKLLRMYRAVKEAQHAALRSLRPRVHTRTVHRSVQEVFRKRGLRTHLNDGKPEGFIHGTGHGVGLEIHEAPSISTVAGILRAGNVVTVEPGLYYSDIGGVRIEDTVVVTSTGWRYIFPCEKPFIL